MTGRLKFRIIIFARRYAIGVAGDSGQARPPSPTPSAIYSAIRWFATITLDDYHICNRAQRDELQITPCIRMQTTWQGLERDLRLLATGKGHLQEYLQSFDRQVEGTECCCKDNYSLKVQIPCTRPVSADLLIFRRDPASVVKQEWKIKGTWRSVSTQSGGLGGD